MEQHNAFRNHLEAYIQIRDEEYYTVLKYFTIRKIKKKEHLVREGDYVNETYWVKKGLLVSGFTSEAGKEHIIQFATEGCWITDQNAFYNRSKALVNIISHENAELLSLSFENREALCNDLPLMARFFLKKSNDSFVKQQKRLLTYLTSDARKRFDLLLEEYPGLFQRLSKKTLAAYLGVTSETLSRLKNF